MFRSERQALTRCDDLPGWPRQPGSRSRILILAGIVLLVGTIVASATGCGSDTQANSDTTTTAAVAGPTGAPSGTPPSAPGGVPAARRQADLRCRRREGRARPRPRLPPASTDSTTTTEAPTTTTTAAEGTYSDGIYLVGTDIDSGLYHGTVNGDKGHWEISSDANGDKFVAGGDPTGPFYVKVTSGQYLTLSGVTIEEGEHDGRRPARDQATSPTAPTGSATTSPSVGTTGPSTAAWATGRSRATRTVRPSSRTTIRRGQFTLKVKSGQYLTLRGVTVSQ